MANEFWTVLEIQLSSNNAKSTLASAYDTEAAAQSAYYTVLAAAVVSQIPYHAAYLINSKRGMQMMQIYDRRENDG